MSSVQVLVLRVGLSSGYGLAGWVEFGLCLTGWVGDGFNINFCMGAGWGLFSNLCRALVLCCGCKAGNHMQE